MVKQRKQKPWSGSKNTDDIDIIETIEDKIKSTVTDQYGLVCFFYYKYEKWSWCTSAIYFPD